MNTPKTLAEHRQYLYDIVRLKLWYIHFLLHRQPGLSFREILQDRVDIFRKTSFNRHLLNPENVEESFQEPAWVAMAGRLERLYRCHEDNAGAFEEEAFSELRPYIDERSVCDWIDVSRLKGYQCGSLRYSEKPEDDEFRTVHFHIANALQPQSMFADPQYLCCCFSELMRQTELRWGSSALCVGSWLNSYPKWLAYFPASFVSHLSEENREIRWHYGFWGQFITSRGTFNAKFGDYFRRTGELPFYPRSGSCTFSELRDHLTRQFGVRFHKEGWMI